MTSQWLREFLRRCQILIGDQASAARAGWVVEALPVSVSVVEHHVVRSILTDYAARVCRRVGQSIDQRYLVSLLDVATERGDARALTARFVRVIELCAQRRETGAAALDSRAGKALDEIACRYASADFTLGRLARELTTSPARLTKLLKRHTGKTFQVLVREHRISAAKQLLRTHALSLTEIASSVGYRRISHFERHFRLVSGVTVSAYLDRRPPSPPHPRVPALNPHRT